MARLLFFGKLGDLAGGRLREEALPDGVATVTALVAAIGDRDPALGDALSAPSVRVVVNETIAARDASVGADDEIAFLPPVSGG
ncbi:MAG: MoaD/ThiS family protein [Hyphococcus sp.]